MEEKWGLADISQKIMESVMCCGRNILKESPAITGTRWCQRWFAEGNTRDGCDP